MKDEMLMLRNGEINIGYSQCIKFMVIVIIFSDI
jgi:hypothetical protein